MESPQEQQGLTLGESLIWVRWMLSLTEKVAGAIPDELLDWRPESKDGEHQFSLAEIVMHIIDARRMFAAQLTGEDYASLYFAPDYWAGDEVPDEVLYRFRSHGGKDALLEQLRQACELFTPFLSLPAENLGHVPEGASAAFQRMVEQFRADGHDTSAMERHGPPTVTHALMAVIAHESGHRGTLGTLLRLNGVKLPD